MKANLKVHFSSQKDDWATPQDIFDQLDSRYGPFDLDVCASLENTKVRSFIDGNIRDSLQCDWASTGKKLWMNPPYGRGIGEWIKKAYEASLQGCLVVCLLPARTDTEWFHKYCTRGKIEFIKGRIKFVGARHGAPFPSMIVVFGL